MGEMFNRSDIAHYLLSLGLVKPQALVEEDLTVVDMSRRNRVFVASTRAGPAYVVKQAARHRAAALDHEVATLRGLAQTAGVATHVPTVVRHDVEGAVAVFQTPVGGRDWTVHHRRRFPVLGTRALGRMLAELHQLPAGALPPAGDATWALQLPEPSWETVLGMSSASQELVSLVQGDQALCDRLEAVRGATSLDGLVHGDLRWDNCLALTGPSGRRRTRVLVVDWESAGTGPVAVDVGAVLAEYLAAWVESVPISDPRDPGRLVGWTGRPLRTMQPAMRAFWLAYTRGSRDPPPLRSVIEFAAVRLLQTAVERAQEMTGLTAHVVADAQLAANLLREPAGAARDLIGLDPP